MSKAKKRKPTDVIRGGKVYRVVKKGKTAPRTRYAIYVLKSEGGVRDFPSIDFPGIFVSKAEAQRAMPPGGVVHGMYYGVFSVRGAE